MTPNDRNWDKELAKFDKTLSSMSDDQLLARRAPAPAESSEAAPLARGTAAGRDAAPPSRLGLIVRVALATGMAIAVPFWPYAAPCGLPLMGYLAAIGVVCSAGVWAALATWRARAGRAHLLALGVLVWGLVLASMEILPRVGYASDPARVEWMCQ
jgi:hypothetical protein